MVKQTIKVSIPIIMLSFIMSFCLLENLEAQNKSDDDAPKIEKTVLKTERGKRPDEQTFNEAFNPFSDGGYVVETETVTNTFDKNGHLTSETVIEIRDAETNELIKTRIKNREVTWHGSEEIKIVDIYADGTRKVIHRNTSIAFPENKQHDELQPLSEDKTEQTETKNEGFDPKISFISKDGNQPDVVLYGIPQEMLDEAQKELSQTFARDIQATPGYPVNGDKLAADIQSKSPDNVHLTVNSAVSGGAGDNKDSSITVAAGKSASSP